MDDEYILVADDDPNIIAIILRTLMSDGYKLRHSTTGAEALEIARQNPPSLLILDVMMPKTNGIFVCKALRRDERFNQMPILIVSARGHTNEIVEGLDAGADDYLAKPFEVPELKARVRALLRRSQNQARNPSDKLIIGDLSLDPNTYEVVSPKSQSRLTATEFKLLHYLMSHHGQVFSHTDLLEAVWHYLGDTGDSDLVRTHIRKLRAKIGDAYIQTIHGVGYLLKAKED